MEGWQSRAAFVIQWRPETDIEAGRFEGRVEHIASYNALRFHSLEELLTFVPGCWLKSGHRALGLSGRNEPGLIVTGSQRPKGIDRSLPSIASCERRAAPVADGTDRRMPSPESIITFTARSSERKGSMPGVRILKRGPAHWQPSQARSPPARGTLPCPRMGAPSARRASGRQRLPAGDPVARALDGRW
jgi:hypothetical protein